MIVLINLMIIQVMMMKMTFGKNKIDYEITVANITMKIKRVLLILLTITFIMIYDER